MKSKTKKGETYKKSIIKVRKYSIIITHYSDGTCNMNREVENFSALELLGVLEKTQLDIMEQIGVKIKPDITTRKAIIDKKKD